jgi:hypothetical protein
LGCVGCAFAYIAVVVGWLPEDERIYIIDWVPDPQSVPRPEQIAQINSQSTRVALRHIVVVVLRVF